MDHEEPQAQNAFVAFLTRWWRLLALIATAVIGLGSAYLILSANDAPRWLLAVSGVFGLIGAASALCITCFVYVAIAEDLRPAFLMRKPHAPAYLTHRQGAMVGRINQRNHPIRFWGGLTLNNRFFVGFMIFDQPEYLEFADPARESDREAA